MKRALFLTTAALAAMTLLPGCVKQSPRAASSNATVTETASPLENEAAAEATESPEAAEATPESEVAPSEPAESEDKPEAEAKPAAEPTPESEEPAAKPEEEQAQAANPPATELAANLPSKGQPNGGADIKPGDWPMWGGTSLRNNTPIAENIPTEWEIGSFDRKTGEWNKDEAQNVKWVSSLGSQSYGNPVVASGRIFVGTNNTHGYLPRYPSEVDLGCMIAFDEKTGEFLWQHSSEKLPTGRVHDWPLQGVCSAPYVDGNRLWFTSNRGHVLCLDVEGFYDGEDDGPVQNELAKQFTIENPAEVAKALDEGKLPEEVLKQLETVKIKIEGEAQVKAEEAGKNWSITANADGKERQFVARIEGPRLAVYKVTTADDKHEADVIWDFDMMKELGVSQHNMCSCSPVAYGDLLFIITGNGVDETHINIPAPEAPSFICMDKNTGEVYWTDNSPGENIMHGQWSSPAVAELGGVPQALFAGGDGYLYAFKADKGKDGKPELLWKFDANPKTSEYILGGRGTRNEIIATPVVYDGLVYLAVGQDPEHGEGEGHLWCIDPTKRGDVSPELAVKIEGDQRVPLPHRRLQAVIEANGEAAVDNPNSAVVWHYSKQDQDGDGEIAWEEEMHRSCGTVAIKDGLLYIADFSGLFHCLDAKTGKVHWTYDMLAASWASPLIVDGHVYISDEDGDICVFKLGADEKEPIAEINMGNSVYTTPIVANGVLYIANRTNVFAIANEGEEAEAGAE